jgi:hypothetical protein
MPSTAPWGRYDPRIRLVIGGQEFPCVRCSADYELNAIPQASATIAVGRDASGAASPIHALVSNFVDRIPAQIYITPNAMGAANNSATQPGDLGLSGGEVRIFNGYVTAAGFTRSRGSAQFNVQLEHWLSELGFSSIFSKSSHPTNPGQYSFGSLGQMGLSTNAAFSNLGIGWKYFTNANIIADFWGKTLLPFFRQLCRVDAFYAPAIGRGQGGNGAALAALGRFNSPWQQPLQLDLAVDADIASNISKHAGAAVGRPDQLAHQTFWDVLVGTFCREYLFYIVPRVEDAIAAPFVPGFNRNFTTIVSNQETQIEWMRGLGRPIRGVGILAGVKSATGVTKPGQGASPLLGIGGYYAPDPSATQGIILIKHGPDWMTQLFAPARYGYNSTGADGKPIGSAVNPGKKPQGRGKGMADQVTQRLTDVIRPFLNSYAQAHYAVEKLRARQAVVAGPFRLDIAPGSTVLVENAGETFIAGDPLGAPFYAHVARVSLAVDGETPSIGTSFHLSHVRSEPENFSPMTAVGRHPLYKYTFAGAPLVDY